MDLNKTNSKEQYDLELQENKTKHEICHKCGGTNFTMTISYMNKSDGFLDLNSCFCFNCKNQHSINQRISKKQYDNDRTKY
jgi:hypothetical protein